MKRELEKATKVNSPSAGKESTQPTGTDRIDKTYLQINQISFRQNFKALIGHYKTNEASPGLERIDL